MTQQLSERSSSDSIAKLSQAINAISNKPKKPELIIFSGEASQWMAFKSSYERTKSVFSTSENLDLLNNAVRRAYHVKLRRSRRHREGFGADLSPPELVVVHEVTELRNSPKRSSPQDLAGAFAVHFG